MIVLTARNVREALPIGIDLLNKYGQREKSQYGDVLVMPCPVTTVYTRPRERVLFDAQRDANPVFHMLESLWMLAGRQDAAFLNRYVRDFGARFAEPGGMIHDAYGHRWRLAFGIDQLAMIVRRLSENPDDRQCVLQMWDADAYDDLNVDSKWRTRPCNTHAYFRAIEGNLDMTVCCRSNDIIWCAYGANAVHFSVLLEYVAAMCDLGVGRYYQLSNNYHAYIDILSKLSGKIVATDGIEIESPSPLAHDPSTFDTELAVVLHAIDCDASWVPELNNRFLSRTAFRADMAMRAFRGGNAVEAVHISATIDADDWRRACVEWFGRRCI